MTRVRARWVMGLGLVISGAAISCGSGDSAGLFTMSSAGAGIGLGSSGASNQAGAHDVNVAGDEAGGAFNQSGAAGADQTSGAPGAGMTSTEGGGSGAPAGGAMGSAGKGGSTGKAGNGGGGAGAGAGGKTGSGGTAGAPSGGAGAGGATAGAGGNGGTSGGGAGTAGTGGSGPVSCSDNAGCPESQYCAKPDCSLGPTGTCTARPVDCGGTAETALCGCDGFTYHDACLMHLNGQNSFAAGACNRLALGTVTCSAANDAACTAKGGVCGFRADTACPAVLPVKGICWVLPATCPSGGGTAKAAEVCNPVSQGPNSFCVSECTAVKNQARYALTAMCN